MVISKKIILAKKFSGAVNLANFDIAEESLATELQDGEFLCEAEYLSIDAGFRLYFERNCDIGDGLTGRQVAKVLETKHPKFPVGSYIVGEFGWRTHTICNPELNPGRIPPYVIPYFGNNPRSLALGMLGLTGNTSYFGLHELCQPKPGETVVVSSAAGGVGFHVCQLAKIHGCRVIGLTSTEEKIKWLKDELGVDYVINYKDANWVEQLKSAAPGGVDCYFDNTGGDISANILANMSVGGRIAVCGAISEYNNAAGHVAKSSHIQPLFVGKELTMEGFIVTRWLDRWMEGIDINLQFLNAGKLKYREYLIEGFHRTPEAFINVLNGENIGKTVVKVK